MFSNQLIMSTRLDKKQSTNFDMLFVLNVESEGCDKVVWLCCPLQVLVSMVASLPVVCNQWVRVVRLSVASLVPYIHSSMMFLWVLSNSDLVWFDCWLMVSYTVDLIGWSICTWLPSASCNIASWTKFLQSMVFFQLYLVCLSYSSKTWIVEIKTKGL